MLSPQMPRRESAGVEGEMTDYNIDPKCCCCGGQGIIPHRVQCEDTMLSCPICLGVSHDTLTARVEELEAMVTELCGALGETTEQLNIIEVFNDSWHETLAKARALVPE